ncbi:MAG: hypothetical protein AAF387_22440, partial [Pseudomonadota bacterium]
VIEVLICTLLFPPGIGFPTASNARRLRQDTHRSIPPSLLRRQYRGSIVDQASNRVELPLIEQSPLDNGVVEEPRTANSRDTMHINEQLLCDRKNSVLSRSIAYQRAAVLSSLTRKSSIIKRVQSLSGQTGFSAYTFGHIYLIERKR